MGGTRNNQAGFNAEYMRHPHPSDPDRVHSLAPSSDLGSVRPVEDARVGFEMFQRFEDQISNENPIQRSFLQCFLRCRLFIDLECDGTRFPVFLQPLLRFVRHFRIVPSRPGSERERLFQSPVAHVHD